MFVPPRRQGQLPPGNLRLRNQPALTGIAAMRAARGKLLNPGESISGLCVTRTCTWDPDRKSSYRRCELNEPQTSAIKKARLRRAFYCGLNIAPSQWHCASQFFLMLVSTPAMISPVVSSARTTRSLGSDHVKSQFIPVLPVSTVTLASSIPSLSLS
jgi:hypothetical protein